MEMSFNGLMCEPSVESLTEHRDVRIGVTARIAIRWRTCAVDFTVFGTDAKRLDSSCSRTDKLNVKRFPSRIGRVL